MWRNIVIISGAVVAGLGIAAGAIALLQGNKVTESLEQEEMLSAEAVETLPEPEEVEPEVEAVIEVEVEKPKKPRSIKKTAKPKPKPKPKAKRKKKETAAEAAANRLKKTFNPEGRKKTS